MEAIEVFQLIEDFRYLDQKDLQTPLLLKKKSANRIMRDIFLGRLEFLPSCVGRNGIINAPTAGRSTMIESHGNTV